MSADGLTRGQRGELVAIVALFARRGIPRTDHTIRKDQWRALERHGLVTLTALGDCGGTIEAMPTPAGRVLVADYPTPDVANATRLARGGRPA